MWTGRRVEYMDKIKPLADVLDEHVERLLDAALEQTFPASDPVAIDVAPAARLFQP